MSKVRIYRVPTAREEAARYASAAGLTLETWQAMDERDRKALKEQLDAAFKLAQRGTRAAARDQHYASALGMTVEAWRGLSDAERKEKRDEIDAREKAAAKVARENERRRAANEKLNRDAKKSMHKKASAGPVPAGHPGATRYSTVVGLMESPTDKKWNLFLREGPYWNYLVNYIKRKNIFRGRTDRVEEAVMNACEKIGKFIVSKRYKYPEEGKGYFRGFLKTVAFRTALDLRREISRQEQIRVSGSDANAMSEFDKMKGDMDKATDRCRKKLEKAKAAPGIEDEIAISSEHDLDVYDVSAGLNRNIAPVEKKQDWKMHSIARLDDNPFSDDEAPVNYNPADIFDFMTKVSKEDLAWVRKLQVHVLYIALGYVLTNAKVSAERREMLRLRYGLDMKLKDIYALPRFASKSREALDAQMSHATDELRKEAASWWKLVAPDKNDFADETVLKFWRELGRTDERAKIAIKLQDKAIGIAGRIK